MLKKTIAILCLVPLLMGAAGETFEQYAERRVKAAVENGQSSVSLKVTSKFLSEAGVYATRFIQKGFYIEVTPRDGFDVLTIFFDDAAKVKQAKIINFVHSYTDGLLQEYDECPDALFVVGLWDEKNYTGNFYHGCGDDFLNSISQNVENLEYKNFDYVNFYICILISLKSKGYTLREVSKGEGIIVSEVIKVDNKKVYNKVPF